MTTFFDRYKDRRWQQKRLHILQLHDWTCQWCKSENNDEELHVHHGYYESNRNPWEYPNDSLFCLCSDCHEKAEVLRRDLKRATGKVPPWKQEALLQNLSFESHPVDSVPEEERGPLSELWSQFLNTREREYLLQLYRKEWLEELANDDDTTKKLNSLRPEIRKTAAELISFWIQESNKWELLDQGALEDWDDAPPVEYTNAEVSPLIEILSGLVLGRVKHNSELLALSPEVASVVIRTIMRISSAMECGFDIGMFRGRFSTFDVLITGSDGPCSAEFKDRYLFSRMIAAFLDDEKQYRENDLMTPSKDDPGETE